jgi:DNA-directed RNA polymerase alpha subunit
MANTRSLANANIDAVFVRALVKSAMQFAPSVDALQRAVIENSLVELGMEAPAAGRKSIAIANGPRKYTRKALPPTASIVELTAGMRRNRSLEKHGINTLEDLTRFSEDELNGLDGVGGKMITRAKELLARASLSLRE